MKSLEYHGRLIFYPVDQVFSNHSIKRILLKRNFICMGALYTATPHKSVFTFWLKCSFKRANRIISLLRAHSSKTSHQAWSKMPSPFMVLGDLALPSLSHTSLAHQWATALPMSRILQRMPSSLLLHPRILPHHCILNTAALVGLLKRKISPVSYSLETVHWLCISFSTKAWTPSVWKELTLCLFDTAHPTAAMLISSWFPHTRPLHT